MVLAIAGLGTFVDPFFAPLLSLPPLFAVAGVSFVVAFFVTAITKLTTNQKALKAIREEMKLLQKAIRSTRSDPAKAGELNKQLMQKTGEQMKHSMRSFVFTMIPLLLILSWMQAHVAFDNIEPGQEFTTTAFVSSPVGNITLSATGAEMLDSAAKQPENGRVTWRLRADTGGTAHLQYELNGQEIYTRDVLITTAWKYADPELGKAKRIFGFNYGDAVPIRQDSAVERIQVNLKPVHPLPFRLFGWAPGWLAVYILGSLLFTFPLRKVLKVH
jgi:uncharacterized membrane protein (DUF106 family)